MGFSLGPSEDNSNKLNLKDLQTEYSFGATEGSILCADGNKNLMALGGFDEVIRLFDVAKKKDLGDLVGEHSGSITSLQFYKNKFLISGSEDSQIIIWRCKDWAALHKLNIMNKSKVVSMSLHRSGKLLLAIYQNRVVRLWNLMNARCTFKRKVCLSAEEEDDPNNQAKKAEDTDDDNLPLDEEAGEDE